MSQPASINRRALARALSRVANASVAEILALWSGAPPTSSEASADAPGAAPTVGPACRRIGITGSPGVGKSTLIARLARDRLRHPGTLAIVAIDPTSPHSGGAILGDRIRMQELADEPQIFIRSLASRVSQDGLSDNLPDILATVEAAGFSELIVETVGVGQVGYAVRRVVDTDVLVLMPGEGDQIQAMKSGILETADICVVNKADLPGARQLAADLRGVVHPRAGGDWAPPVIEISLADPAGVAELGLAIDRHQAWLARRDGRDAILVDRRAHHVGSLLARRTAEIVAALPRDVLSHQPLAATYAAIVAELYRSDKSIPVAGPNGGDETNVVWEKRQ